MNLCIAAVELLNFHQISFVAQTSNILTFCSQYFYLFIHLHAMPTSGSFSFLFILVREGGEGVMVVRFHV